MSLTKAEAYQFSLCNSEAKTIPAQRAAIAREGLAGATRASVRNSRQAAFREFREKQPDLAKLPAWVAAARFEAIGYDWLHVSPIPAGTVWRCDGLANMAYDSVDWGRLRKHSRGNASAFPPRRREETNGRTGRDCVIWRYADYLCILSPCRGRVAVQVDGKPITVHAVFRGRCMYRGVRIQIVPPTLASVASMTHRATARRLRLHGYDARVIRQTPASVASGLGDNCRRGGQVVVILPDGIGGWYHASLGQTVESVRSALAKRRVVAKQEELDSVITSAGDRIWVTIADSISAGNCQPGTSSFCDGLMKLIGANGEVGAATASAILATCDNEFTRRACRVAAIRYLR
jgi:hypothetical protein